MGKDRDGARRPTDDTGFSDPLTPPELYRSVAGTIGPAFCFPLASQLFPDVSRDGMPRQQIRISVPVGSTGRRSERLMGVSGVVVEKKARDVKPAAGSAPRKKRGSSDMESHVAGSLKTAYDETVREAVPQEFLDLLGKLS